MVMQNLEWTVNVTNYQLTDAAAWAKVAAVDLRGLHDSFGGPDWVLGNDATTVTGSTVTRVVCMTPPTNFYVMHATQAACENALEGVMVAWFRKQLPAAEITQSVAWPLGDCGGGPH
jgi:hypothetical protein